MVFSKAAWLAISITWTKQRKKDVCGKKDWGSRTSEPDIKFKRMREFKTVNEQVFIEIGFKQWEMMVWIWNTEFKIGNHRYS